jgi:hypothetical protein
MAQVTEHLLCKHEALRSNPIPQKKIAGNIQTQKTEQTLLSDQWILKEIKKFLKSNKN